jgi:hypothetical protein
MNVSSVDFEILKEGFRDFRKLEGRMPDLEVMMLERKLAREGGNHCCCETVCWTS